MRRPVPPLTHEPARILVTALCPIGDTLFLTPALARLRERFVGARISVVVSAANEGILADNPDVDERILFPDRSEESEATRFARGVRRLGQERPDLIVNFSAAGAIVTTLAGLRAPRLGLDMPRLWGLVGARTEAYRHRHAIDHYFKVIEPVAPAPRAAQARAPRFYLTNESRRAARQLLVVDGMKPSDLIVTMHVGGDGFDGRKRWAPERFARVANYLVERFDAHIVLVGGKADIPMTNASAALIRRNVRSLAGKTPLKVTAALIEASALFIGNDSSPLHIAAAVGTPSVGIYGPSDTREFHPVGQPGYRGRLLHSDLPCAPCFRFVGNAPLWQVNTCYSYACLKAIDTRQVMEAAVELLQRAVVADLREPATAPDVR
jgi:ADP-heptose:LPS heptosyltransferase